MQVVYQHPGDKKKYGIGPDIIWFYKQDNLEKKAETIFPTSVFSGTSKY
jgi:hypothetical protein